MTKDRSNKYFMMFQSAKSIELSDAARPPGENAAAESDRLFSIVGSRLFWNELWFEYWERIGAAPTICSAICLRRAKQSSDIASARPARLPGRSSHLPARNRTAAISCTTRSRAEACGR